MSVYMMDNPDMQLEFKIKNILRTRVISSSRIDLWEQIKKTKYV